MEIPMDILMDIPMEIPMEIPTEIPDIQPAHLPRPEAQLPAVWLRCARDESSGEKSRTLMMPEMTVNDHPLSSINNHG